MTAYFDDLSRQVRTLSEEIEDEDEFINAVADEVEEGLIKTVSLATGDREFPYDLREKIQNVVALNRLKGPDGTLWNGELLFHARISRSSSLVENLHSAFHEVARRRVKTRFGVLLDDPSTIVCLRDDHDIDVEE